MSSYDFMRLAYVNGVPQCLGRLKIQPSDFKVIEQIAYPLSGEGEHLWLWIEKQGLNTDDVVKQLAKQAKIPLKAIGYAGKKDRHAVTQQWISLHLPGKHTPDVSQWNMSGVKILKSLRHHRKLQTGGLSANRFELIVRQVTGDVADLIARCEQVAQKGVPNYFGEQRFGREMGNLDQATALFAGKLKRVPKHQKGLYLSAVRSWVFNQILSERVKDGSWQHILPGDMVMLSGSERCFSTEQEDVATLNARVKAGDISPTGLLPGLGELKTAHSVADLEQEVVSKFLVWQTGLEKQGVKQARRALILRPKAFEYTLKEVANDTQLHLNFTLPAGAYATMVTRACLQT